MEWSTDTKTGCDDLEVYMEYGYVFVSSTGRNNVKMAASSFKFDPQNRNKDMNHHQQLGYKSNRCLVKQFPKLGWNQLLWWLSGLFPLGPLLLTGINFNPSMDK